MAARMSKKKRCNHLCKKN